MCIFLCCVCVCSRVCVCGGGGLLWYSHFVLRLSVSCQTFIFISPAVLPRGKWNLRNYKHSNYNMHSAPFVFLSPSPKRSAESALTRQLCLKYVTLLWNKGACFTWQDFRIYGRTMWRSRLLRCCSIRNHRENTTVTPEASVQVMLCRLKRLTTHLSSSVFLFSTLICFSKHSHFWHKLIPLVPKMIFGTTERLPAHRRLALSRIITLVTKWVLN